MSTSGLMSLLAPALMLSMGATSSARARPALESTPVLALYTSHRTVVVSLHSGKAQEAPGLFVQDSDGSVRGLKLQGRTEGNAYYQGSGCEQERLELVSLLGGLAYFAHAQAGHCPSRPAHTQALTVPMVAHPQTPIFKGERTLVCVPASSNPKTGPLPEDATIQSICSPDTQQELPHAGNLASLAPDELLEWQSRLSACECEENASSTVLSLSQGQLVRTSDRLDPEGPGPITVTYGPIDPRSCALEDACGASGPFARSTPDVMPPMWVSQDGRYGLSWGDSDPGLYLFEKGKRLPLTRLALSERIVGARFHPNGNPLLEALKVDPPDLWPVHMNPSALRERTHMSGAQWATPRPKTPLKDRSRDRWAEQRAKALKMVRTQVSKQP